MTDDPLTEQPPSLEKLLEIDEWGFKNGDLSLDAKAALIRVHETLYLAWAIVKKTFGEEASPYLAMEVYKLIEDQIENRERRAERALRRAERAVHHRRVHNAMKIQPGKEQEYGE